MKRNDYDRIPVGPLTQPNPPWARIKGVCRWCSGKIPAHVTGSFCSLMCYHEFHGTTESDRED
jgi:hypothetical protein